MNGIVGLCVCLNRVSVISLVEPNLFSLLLDSVNVTTSGVP